MTVDPCRARAEQFLADIHLPGLESQNRWLGPGVGFGDGDGSAQVSLFHDEKPEEELLGARRRVRRRTPVARPGERE